MAVTPNARIEIRPTGRPETVQTVFLMQDGVWHTTPVFADLFEVRMVEPYAAGPSLESRAETEPAPKRPEDMEPAP